MSAIATYRKIAKEKFSHEQEYSSGICCDFLPACNKWGIKIYTNKDKRDECYEWQKEASKHEFGPQTMGKFQFAYKGQRLYCYITEKVEPLWDSLRDGCSWELNQRLQRKYAQQINQAVSKLKSIGFIMEDDHAGNFGFKDDKLICIDFGIDD